MKQSANIATIFPKHLFWEMDHSKLDLSRDKAIIIPRSLYATIPATFEADIQKLEEFYSPEDIVDTLSRLKKESATRSARLSPNAII